jgi:trehalose-6-phosphate synthase
MIPSPLPLISKQDYPRFQQMIRELLDTTYEEWCDDHARSVAYRRSRNGSSEVSISPDEFAACLKENQMVAHLELLWAFAEAKAERTSTS